MSLQMLEKTVNGRADVVNVAPLWWRKGHIVWSCSWDRRPERVMFTSSVWIWHSGIVELQTVWPSELKHSRRVPTRNQQEFLQRKHSFGDLLFERRLGEIRPKKCRFKSFLGTYHVALSQDDCSRVRRVKVCAGSSVGMYTSANKGRSYTWTCLQYASKWRSDFHEMMSRRQWLHSISVTVSLLMFSNLNHEISAPKYVTAWSQLSNQNVQIQHSHSLQEHWQVLVLRVKLSPNVWD